MEYLKIKNTGLLDIRLIYLMGGTTKANDKYKIGQFGTGLKYTFAYVLRNNILFHLFIDGQEQEIASQKEVIRDTEFNIIYVNGDKTSITTNMGREWKAWMIIRELYANCMDEENGGYEIVNEVNPDKGTTEFYLQNTSEVKEVVDNWHKYFIHEIEPLQDEKDFAIYEGGEGLRVYKNGFLIKELSNVKSVFYYDIKDASINELREFNGSVELEVASILPKYKKHVIEKLLANIKDTWEDEMDYSWGYHKTYGEDWKEALGDAKLMDYETYEKLVDKRPELKEQPIVQVPKGLFGKLVEKFPSITMLRASDKVNSFYETYSDELNDRIKKCVNILQNCGYFIDPELKILTGIFGNKNIRASVNLDAKEIHISQDLETLSEIDLMYALVEENEHYKTGYHDESRAFQSHFIILYTNLLLKESKVLLQ